MERWKLNRAGVLNFWYYDEQEFVIEGGRVLFRGANGAGKSVTMQSFLPLVLDGDTRPSRLDPFGSRDRKIDYYLLGDQGQHAERTGYLWLEFAHGKSGRYVTIGIGLRARRGNKDLDFWGFAITDNRRIGKEFDLFQREYSTGQELKIPHPWRVLRENIGEGGHFVRERKEYAALVNKLLFRYENGESFAEMLHLLLQLRSPKLSKDFKPTTIYGILNNALPSLEEAELYPLAEVLESIDQIGDRQRELESHVGFVQQLDKAYGTYNRYQLFQRSEKVVQFDDQLIEKDRIIQLKGMELAAAEQELADKNQQEQQNQQALKAEQAEIQLLEQHEAFSKEQELKGKREQKQTLDRNVQKARHDLAYWREQDEKVQRQVKDWKFELQQGVEKQESLLENLEATAREIEFLYHDVIHRRVSREMEQEAFWESWNQGIREHKDSLQRAMKCAKEHAQAKKEVADREGQLLEARERRDESERQLNLLKDGLDQEKERQQERIFVWRNDLQELIVSEEEMIRILQQLALFPVASYEEVRAVAGTVYDPQLQEVRVEAVQAKGLLKNLQEEEQVKRIELHSWQHQREPEPVRSLQRERTRHTYPERQVTGIPLYAACEFLPQVPEETRAMLESLMQETGLLDAWVGEPGLQWETEDQEFWVQPQPLLIGCTLADYLRPTPPEDGSLSAEQIQDVLRSVEVNDDVQGSERVVLSEQGYFQLGTLLGKVQPKDRAEYIGKESRKQTRLATIARLQAELAALVQRVEDQERTVLALQAREKQLQKEFALFPTAKELHDARNAVEKGQMRLEAAQGEVEQKNEQHKRVMEKEREVRELLMELTQAWSSLKNERRLDEAIDQLRTYQSDFLELQSVCSRYITRQKQISDGEAQLEVIAEKMETEEIHLVEYEAAIEDVQAVITAYENALKQMQVEEKYERLQALRRSEGERLKKRKDLADGIYDIRRAIDVVQVKLEELKEARSQILSEQEDILWEWRTEWNLRLVSPWREQELADQTDGQVSLCRSIRQSLAKEFDTRRTMDHAVSNLFKVFHEVSVHLHLYVLEWEEQNGRQLVQFHFDRGKPLSPEQLLEQLSVQLAEQNLLLNEREKELLEKVLIQSVGVSIRQKIQRADEWVREMNHLMGLRNTSSGLQLKLKWEPKEKGSEMEIETSKLVELLRTDYEHLTNENREELYQHFKAKIQQAKEEADNVGALRDIIHQFLDYRQWYRFKLFPSRGSGPTFVN